MRSKNPKFHLVTKCCSSSVYRDKGSFQLLCAKCSGLAQYQKIPNLRYVITGGEKVSPTKGKAQVKTVEYMPYKPPHTLSARDRNEEILKRSEKVSEYTNQVTGITDTTEIKFIKQRIKWNNDRIALLLG